MHKADVNVLRERCKLNGISKTFERTLAFTISCGGLFLQRATQLETGKGF